ncbi:CaiB/BaiF CoA transferase family protein [Sphingopyxis sp.]|uniref:CaiB/BaiF CoA transferase family protein n=1 Tax=Sphingopyxis sp. TaxID=1908224 RepID=UPI0035AFA6AC
MTGALEGVRVLDLSRVLAGPWATQLLADMGASVIKVERPIEGDDTRHWGPPWIERNGHLWSAYYLAANRGKESIAIDIATPAGQQLVRDLARGCDVFVENFKVGGLERYGLDEASLREVNPSIIYCSITGFGQDGPYRDRPGYDFIAQGMGGLMSVTGSLESGPMKTGVALSDIMTGLYATISILAALVQRANSREGAHLDIALLDVTVATLANQALNYFATGTNPARYGNAHPNIVPYQSFRTADRGLNVAVGNDRQFLKLCQAIEKPELGRDERFATNAARSRHKAELDQILGPVFLSRSCRDWLSALDDAGVPAGPINDIADVFSDPHIVHRGLQIAHDHPEAGAIPGVASPIIFDGKRACADRYPPGLGEQGSDILARELGLDHAEIEALRTQGVIG